MTMPGFSAEAAVYSVKGTYRTMNITGRIKGQEGTVGALTFHPIIGPGPIPISFQPQLTVTYQPPRPPFGMGFAGTLTIVGQYFAQNIDVSVKVCNCNQFGPFVVDSHTSLDRSACLSVPPYTCFTIPGGDLHRHRSVQLWRWRGRGGL